MVPWNLREYTTCITITPRSILTRRVVPVKVPHMGQIELFEQELFNHSTVCKQITDDKLNYLKPFKFVQIKQLGQDINTWSHSSVCKQMINTK